MKEALVPQIRQDKQTIDVIEQSTFFTAKSFLCGRKTFAAYRSPGNGYFR